MSEHENHASHAGASDGADNETCPKCRSRKVIPRVRIIDRNANSGVEELSVEVHEYPYAMFFRGTHRGYLSASVCGECGFTELYLEDPAAFHAAYESALARQRDDQIKRG